ncbi:MAG: beta-ketoacyl-[acyl-carrier-protein] synthase family protein [Gemmatimonadales bacterium]
MTTREVWVTGVGAVTAAGIGAEALFELVFSGRTAVGRLDDLGGQWGARAPTPSIGRAGRRLDRSALLLVAAAEEAWADARLARDSFDPRRTDVIEGSSLGCFGELLAAHREQLAGHASALDRPSALTRYMLGAGSARFAEVHGIRGRVLHLSAGSVSATCAIAEGFERIECGRADIVVAGGGECALQRDVVRIFDTAGLLAGAEDEVPCRPFDEGRHGTVLGEGAGVLVLESAEHARARGKGPRAVILGAGVTCEAYAMTAPDPAGSGVVDAVRAALAGYPDAYESVGWIKTHGTGTRLNDAAEWRGLSSLFGGRLAEIPLTSLKPAIGHCLGASGAVEAVAAVLALEWGLIPPTIGTSRIDPELPPCRVALRTTLMSRSLALLLSESFGGRCAALAMRRASAFN